MLGSMPAGMSLAPSTTTWREARRATRSKMRRICGDTTIGGVSIILAAVSLVALRIDSPTRSHHGRIGEHLLLLADRGEKWLLDRRIDHQHRQHAIGAAQRFADRASELRTDALGEFGGILGGGALGRERFENHRHIAHRNPLREN